MENNDGELGRNEVRAFLFGIINDMSDEEMRQLLKDLEAPQNKERRLWKLRKMGSGKMKNKRLKQQIALV